MTKIRFWPSSHFQVVESVAGFTRLPHHGSPSNGLLSGSCARRFVRTSEYEPDREGTFHVRECSGLRRLLAKRQMEPFRPLRRTTYVIQRPASPSVLTPT